MMTNDSTEMPNKVGTASRTRRIMYASTVYEKLFLEEELGRIDESVVAQRVILNEAGLHVAERILDDPGGDGLADDADGDRGITVELDDVHEQCIPLGLVGLGAQLLPGAYD